MKILAIETSCDDTSMALVEITEPKKRGEMPVFKVLKNIVSSQTEIHRHWGGVVPNLAKREHLKNLPIVYEKLLGMPSINSGDNLSAEQSRSVTDIDLIAVTVGPGLEPSLWTGIEFAKKLSAGLNVPFVGANHLEGHLYSNLLNVTPRLRSRNKMLVPEPVEGLPKFPTIVLLVSGGHTILVLMKSLRSWKKLGETRDDAVGEAFDKVAKMTGLPYPGGPEIEALAARGNPQAIKFPRPMIHERNYDFSFSGLKTAVLYYLKDKEKSLTVNGPLPLRKGGSENYSPFFKGGGRRPGDFTKDSMVADLAASFQAAAIDVLVTKTFRAVEEFGAKSVFLCGGVAANKALRAALQSSADKAGVRFFAPSAEYNTDNAAMIAAAAYMRTNSRKKKYPIEADSNLTL